MRDESEVPDLPASRLTPANENPWYVLMTLYGDDHDANRRAWNALYGGQGNIQLMFQEKIKGRFRELFSKQFDLSEEDFQIPSERETVNLSYCHFPERLDIRGFSFGSIVDLSGSVFEKGLDATGSIFLKCHHCEGGRFENSVLFDNSSFHDQSYFSGSTFRRSAVFEDSVFEGALYLDFSFANWGVNFSNSVFKKLSSFRRSEFGLSVLFDAAEFHKRVDFSYSKFLSSGGFGCDVNFRDCRFEQAASFHGVVFQ